VVVLEHLDFEKIGGSKTTANRRRPEEIVTPG